jgi:peptidoglycan/LPS O-acetylase OafA/YrhL
MRTLASEFDVKRNGLNAIRLVLACLVIVSHSWPLGGFGNDPGFGDQDLGDWAVAGFFAISGYLILGSRLHSRSLIDYMWRRFLRIYPGFLVCLVAVAFVFAPISVAFAGGSYEPMSAIGYVANNVALYVRQLGIDGTLAGVPFEGSWNGPLWTLFYEFVCYVGVGVLVSLVPRRFVGRAVVAIFVLCTLATVVHLAFGVGGDGVVVRLARLGAFFAAGGILYAYSPRIRMHLAIAVAAAVLVIVAAGLGLFQALGGLPVAYLMMYLGSRLPMLNIKSEHDVSYGMYIYAFPIQQLIATVVGDQGIPVVLYIVLALLLTAPLAIASRLWVERPAETLKSLTAGRPIPVATPTA